MNASTVNSSVARVAMNASFSSLSVPNVTATGMHEAWPPPFMLNSLLIMAVVAGSFLYVSPISSVLRCHREQMSLKELASWLVPTYFIFAQSYLWGCYGYHTGSLGIARFNSIGAAVCLVYILLVARCAQPRETVQPTILLAMSAIVVFSIGIVAVSRDASQAFAYSATFFNIGMIVAPLREAAYVVRTGSVHQFPMAITVATFFQSLLWAQYSVLIHDQLYLIPNLIGTVICGAELLIVYWIAGLSGGASLRDSKGHEGLSGEDQPLMPRARGKAGLSNCNNLLRFLSGAATKEVASGLPEPRPAVFTTQQQFPAERRFEMRPCARKAAHAQHPQKSPFSSWTRAESMDGFAESFDESEFEPRETNQMEEQDNANLYRSIVNGGGHLSFDSATNGLDCIL